MKFVAYNGYYKFYPEYHKEEEDIKGSLLRDNLTQVKDYYTFNRLAKLKPRYIKGEMILDKIKCPKTVEASPFNLENIFILTGLFYDYTTGTIFRYGNSSSVISYSAQYSLPICGIRYPIIRGKIEKNKVIIQ